VDSQPGCAIRSTTGVSALSSAIRSSRQSRFRCEWSQPTFLSFDGYAPHVVTSIGLHRPRTVSRLALATALVTLLSVLSLITFFIAGAPFGLINDVANGLIGLLSLALAWVWVRNRRSGWSTVALAAAALGAIVMVMGSLLIIFDITGWYLAGLVSSVGNALIGIWLLIENRLQRRAPELPRGLILLGVTAAIFMIIGWLAIAGVIARIDDPQLAPWYVNAGLINWTGTYLLYPAWCLWLSRKYGG
jgi:hypothetical protein